MNAVLSTRGASSDHIRNVACESFCQSGYKGTVMRNLAAALGIELDSLYSQVESKQRLLYELITAYESGLLEVFKDRRLERCNSAIELNSLLWEKVSNYILLNRSLALLACKEVQHLNDMQLNAIAEIRCRRMDQLESLISQCANEIGLGSDGLAALCEELNALIDCFINLEAEPHTDPAKYARQQLRSMALMFLVKRD